MKILGVIPARYASSRYPGKPLVLINEKTMIQHVWDRCVLSQQVTEWVVATDDHTSSCVMENKELTTAGSGI